MAKNAKEAAYNAFGYEASRAEVHQHGENCTHISNCETLNMCHTNLSRRGSGTK